MKRLFRYLFLLDEPYLNANGNRHWRVSVLRVFLAANLGLGTLLTLPVLYAALQQGAYHIVAVVISILVFAVVVWAISRRHPDLASVGVLLMVYIGGGMMMFMNQFDEVKHLGLVFIYLTPLLAWMLLGAVACWAVMALNCVPTLFMLLLPAAQFRVGFDLTMPHSIEYVLVLMFLCFNIGMPLVMLRVRKALEASAQRQVRTIRRLQSSAEMYQEVFENCGSAAVICGAGGRVIRANAHAYELSSRSLAQHAFLPDSLRLEGNETVSWNMLQKQHEEKDFLLEGQEGRRHWVRVQATPMRGSRNWFITLRDISSLRRVELALSESEQRAGYLASHDLLTGLNNRDEFLDCVAGQIAANLTRKQASVAVIYIRLNNIRQINEKYGIPIGDLVIRNIAQRLTKLQDEGIKVARLRGLVFSMLVQNIADAKGLEICVQQMEEKLPREMSLAEGQVHLSFAIGAAMQSKRSDSAPELLRRAERALGEARRKPLGSYALFDDSMSEQVRREIEIELALPHALEHKELCLHYQPKVRANGRVESLEALSRWNSLDLGMVPAAEFIHVAEKSGLITAVTEYVLELACQQQARWQAEIGYTVPVAINLSGSDLRREDLADMFRLAIHKHGIAASCIQIEITETALVDNDAIALRQLDELTRCGFSLALDDFGRGYSSLSKLSEFPIATIKVDRSFVTGIGLHHRREQIVKATLSLARALQCSSVAEGVETPAQFEFLRAQGCEIFQGFLFHKPMPASDITRLLREQHAQKMA